MKSLYATMNNQELALGLQKINDELRAGYGDSLRLSTKLNSERKYY